MEYEELYDKLKFADGQSVHFMPNEIFCDLQKNIKKSPHIAFAYSYYYLISWLYRNTKYYDCRIDVKTIKSILGYSPTTKTINGIIKNGGSLDKLGYTEHSSNYPLSWSFDEFGDPDFTKLNDLDDLDKNEIRKKMGNRFTMKTPIKHFHRDEVDIEYEMKTGVFYDVSNTHKIDFEVFIHCMSIKDLGVTAFYLYGYLKMKNQIFSSGYDVTMPDLCEETKLSYQSLVNYLDVMRKYRLIEVIHNQDYYAPGMEKEYRKANTYIANRFLDFVFSPSFYRKMRRVSYDEHTEIIKRNNKKLKSGLYIQD